MHPCAEVRARDDAYMVFRLRGDIDGNTTVNGMNLGAVGLPKGGYVHLALHIAFSD